MQEAAELLQRAEIPADKGQPVPEDRDCFMAGAVSEGFHLHCIISLQPLMHRKCVGEHDHCHKQLRSGFAVQVDILQAEAVRLEVLEAVLDFPTHSVDVSYRTSWPA